MVCFRTLRWRPFLRFWVASPNSMRGNEFKLCHGKFTLDIRKNLSSKRVVRHWNRCPKEVGGGHHPLEIFKKRVEVAMG